MRLSVTTLFLSGTLALGVAAPAHAQRTDRSAPTFTLLAGVATGEGSYDLGLSIGGSFRWKLVGNGLALRADPWLGRYKAGDASLTILGAAANLEYNFQTEGSSATPFIFLGPAVYYSNFGGDVGSPGGDEGSTDLGFGLGGGVRFAPRFVLEVRYNEINGFSTIPIMLGFRF